MTRDELRTWWQSATPAEKADRIATSVMGWHKSDLPGNPCWWVSETESTDHQWYDTDDYYHPVSAWSPSENIADAWDVRDLMRTKDHAIQSDFVDEVIRAIQRRDSNLDSPFVLLNLTPDDICLAALIAVTPEG